jgi:hypothetical protein
MWYRLIHPRMASRSSRRTCRSLIAITARGDKAPVHSALRWRSQTLSNHETQSQWDVRRLKKQRHIPHLWTCSAFGWRVVTHVTLLFSRYSIFVGLDLFHFVHLSRQRASTIFLPAEPPNPQLRCDSRHSESPVPLRSPITLHPTDIRPLRSVNPPSQHQQQHGSRWRSIVSWSRVSPFRQITIHDAVFVDAN